MRGKRYTGKKKLLFLFCVRVCFVCVCALTIWQDKRSAHMSKLFNDRINETRLWRLWFVHLLPVRAKLFLLTCPSGLTVASDGVKMTPDAQHNYIIIIIIIIITNLILINRVYLL